MEYAFPSEGLNGPQLGMTLRDYFAAKALQGYLAQGVIPSARACWDRADAMLAERQK